MLHNVFVGAETGLLKGVNTSKTKSENLNPLKNLTKQYEIGSMCWRDETEKEVLVGLRNQTVNVFNTKRLAITKSINVTGGEGPLKGIATYQDNLITCSSSGFLGLWNSEGQCEVSFEVGDDIYSMKQNQSVPNIVATGGRENELKLWNLNRLEYPVFTGKNVQNDFLDLRVPVWIYDIAFVPNSEKMITVTGHHQIRLYDLALRQRRPAIDMEFDEYPITSVSLAHRENQIVIGNARGRMALIDLRKKAMVHTFKGFAGSIRAIKCHPTQPLIASCGLDRFLRIHDLNTHRLLFKLYMKSRLNCLLLRKDFVLKEELEEEIENRNQQEIKQKEDDELWNEIGVISDEEEKSVYEDVQPTKRKCIEAKKKSKKKRKIPT